MFKRRSVVGAAVMALVLSAAGAASSGAAVPAKKYSNCAALNRAYAHGVGRPGARDKTSSEPVTTFKVSRSLYQQNRSSDRDRDGIACEKK
jgi:Excalibur calcium-binding domain